MSNAKKDNPTRRKFLSLGLLSGAALLAGKAEAIEPEEEKVKMLSPDGTLVEVDKRIFEEATGRQKVEKKDILNWTQAVK